MAQTLSELYDELRVSSGAERARAAAASGTSEDPFILKLAQMVLSYGLQVKASDIHIEPTAMGARIRYRIDGMLHEMLKLPVESRDALTRAIKIKANLVNEVIGRSKPQDGRIDLEADGRKIDLRLSSFPTLFGDVLALRVFDRSAPLLALEQVGFPPGLLKTFEQLICRPNGMLLVTGPAGSGKTSTLYAVLNKIRSPHIKIVTLEDPVEYQVEGVDQAQINAAIGLTFASGLRAILRQDANVILVGEIRDKETADIAIRAALTGHLVFSTVHTRNALGAAARLVDMGIEPHLFVSSVNGVLAQRLVRVLCPKCKTPDPVAQKTFASLWTRETGSAPPAEMNLSGLSKAAGCPVCNKTGYQGRVGIFELLVLDDEIKQFILDRASGQQFAKVGGRAMRTMIVQGLERATQGITTLDEVLRAMRTMMVHGLERAAQGITTIDEVLRVTGGSED